jgi:condensin complex subunit 1
MRRAAEKKPAKNAKDQDEIEQVAGNAEDDIGDTILNIRERELLFGTESLLALYGPMIVHICGTPKAYKVSTAPFSNSPAKLRLFS